MTYYTKDHEWLVCEDDVATVGITRHAADALGDLVFVEVQITGTAVEAEGVAATVESVKAASEIYAPVAGTIVQINPAVVDDPSIVGNDPEGEGWLFKLKLDDVGDLAGLMDRASYDALVADS
jgi:glycine cleavage system H protein